MVMVKMQNNSDMCFFMRWLVTDGSFSKGCLLAVFVLFIGACSHWHSRHANIGEISLVIWLNENVLFH